MDTQLNLFPDDTILRNASPKLVAFTGRAGSGKSVAAQALIGEDYQRIKFADGLKSMLAALYTVAGLNGFEIHDRIEGDLKEDPDPVLNGASPRHAMQTLGNEWGREMISPTLWVSIWTQAVLKAFSEGKNVVVDDVRYQNEVEAVHRLGGCVVQIERPLTSPVTPKHPSEKFNFKPDVVVHNTTGVIDLHQRIVAEFS